MADFTEVVKYYIYFTGFTLHICNYGIANNMLQFLRYMQRDFNS